MQKKKLGENEMEFAPGARLKIDDAKIALQNMEDYVDYSLPKAGFSVIRLPTFSPESPYPWPLACTLLSRRITSPNAVYAVFCRRSGKDSCGAAIAVTTHLSGEVRMGMYAPGNVPENVYIMFMNSMRRALALVTNPVYDDPDRLRSDTERRIPHCQLCGKTIAKHISCELALLRWVTSVSRHQCIVFEDRDAIIIRAEEFFLLP